jgi:AraC family transcriptional regulator of adaptative response/methylated-DNA-[protein]-cysteine methyltransferase
MRHHLDPQARRADAYEPIARAIDYLVANWEAAPSLDDAARHVGMSPTHFQRVFTEGAGVSPKRFLQHVSASEAKRALVDGRSVLDASFAAGLSGPSRLHDLFLVSEAMTPGQWSKKGEGLLIRYAEADGPFGRALIGATDKGICWLSFVEAEGFARGQAEMRADWRAAHFVEDADFVGPLAERAFAFARGEASGRPLALHVQGTNFQLKVWDALLRIPLGATTSYGALGDAIGAPKAARAVGSAVGANMISLLIPCHRVLRASGAIKDYRWGGARKKALLAMEAAIGEARAA